MFSTRRLLVTISLLELATGAGMLVLPALVIRLLFGTAEPSVEALIVCRVLGGALLAIGLTCWFARDDDPNPARQGILAGALIFNVVAFAVLLWAGIYPVTTGLALWPVVLIHLLMAIWCAARVRQRA